MDRSFCVCGALLLIAATIASGQFVGCDNDTYQCYVCVNPPCFGNGQSYVVCTNLSTDCSSGNDMVCVTVKANAPPTCFASVPLKNNPSTVVSVCTLAPCTAQSCPLNVTSGGSSCNLTGLTIVANREYASDRYFTSLAVQTRQRHFYCSGFGQNGIAGYPDSVAKNSSYWTVFFQFPLLSYMDNARKWALFRVLLETAGRPAGDLDNLCVGNYTQYGVSTYNEGMLLHLYFNNSAINTAELNSNFTRNITATFLGKQALDITAYWNLYQNPPSTDVQPYFLRRPTGMGLTPDQDPTLHAVYLGSWSGYYPLELVLPGVAGRFASNPNPVDYGLEVGDYFFAVFGSIFVFLLLVVIVLGFIIHPLFLDN